MTTRISGAGSIERDRGVAAVRPLRAFLQIDALASGLLGVLLVAAGSQLTGWLGLPMALLVPTGVFLAAFAVWVWRVGSRPMPDRVAVRAIIVANVLWVLASAVVAATGWFSPTRLGVAFILLQAGAVAVFAAGQSAGLRRTDEASSVRSR
jgi:hypothetical protein